MRYKMIITSMQNIFHFELNRQFRDETWELSLFQRIDDRAKAKEYVIIIKLYQEPFYTIQLCTKYNEI